MKAKDNSKWVTLDDGFSFKLRYPASSLLTDLEPPRCGSQRLKDTVRIIENNKLPENCFFLVSDRVFNDDGSVNLDCAVVGVFNEPPTLPPSTKK